MRKGRKAAGRVGPPRRTEALFVKEKNVKRLILVLAAVAVFVGVVARHAKSQQQPRRQAFMQTKLNHSQKLLEGLALEDFDSMAKHAQALSVLSLDAQWQVLQTTEYAHQSLEFRRTADALAAAAKNKNLDGAALAYVEMTMKCVHCHKYLRNVRNGGNSK